jgi:hypothetical protein
VKASQYIVVAFPTLDTELELSRLRDRFDTHLSQTQPHIPLVPPFSPANLDELLGVTEYVGQARRSLHPLSASFRGCVERGELIVFTCLEGSAELQQLHSDLLGSRPVSFLKNDVEFEPRLVAGHISDPALRRQVMLEAGRIGRILALVDALSLVRAGPDAAWRPVAKFPFGIGRVDYYEKLLP